MNTTLLLALFALLFCCVFADQTVAEHQQRCAVGASAKKRVGAVQREITIAMQSLKKVVKELMDIPRVLVSETLKEGVVLVQDALESVGDEITTQINALSNQVPIGK